MNFRLISIFFYYLKFDNLELYGIKFKELIY